MGKRIIFICLIIISALIICSLGSCGVDQKDIPASNHENTTSVEVDTNGVRIKIEEPSYEEKLIEDMVFDGAYKFSINNCVSDIKVMIEVFNFGKKYEECSLESSPKSGDPIIIVIAKADNEIIISLKDALSINRRTFSGEMFETHFQVKHMYDDIIYGEQACIMVMSSDSDQLLMQPDYYLHNMGIDKFETFVKISMQIK
ncbi:MAG: hypothetical protein IKF93_05965 [Lachnospiraceae bacterium]|nr:hypothetical protein [Lachnospiraceae bacterium]